MKDNEFKEKVPIVFALNESTRFFNEDNYIKAIEILEEVLKQDPSMDFTGSIRRDVWYNLSINYIVTNQFDRAIDKITELLKKKNEVVRPGYRVFFNEELTQSQKHILRANHRFQSFKAFLDSSKYRNKFKLFVLELGNNLNQIKEMANIINNTTILHKLNILKDIFRYFGECDPYGKWIFNEEKLQKIHDETQELINLYIDKENESILKAFEEDLSIAEEMCKNNLFSKAQNKLENILDKYYNFQFRNYMSGTLYDVERVKINIFYHSDEKFKKIINLLFLIKEKEIEELPEDERLKRKFRFEQYNPNKRKIEMISTEDEINSITNTDYITINRMIHTDPLKFHQLLKEGYYIEKYIDPLLGENGEHNELASVSEVYSIPSKFRAFMRHPITKKDFKDIMNTTVDPINEKYENLKREVKKHDLRFIQEIDNLPELKKFLDERDNLIQEIYTFYSKDFDRKRLDDLIFQFYSNFFDFNPYEVDFQFIPYIFNSIMKLKMQHKIGPKPFLDLIKYLDNVKLVSFLNKVETLNFDSKKLEYLRKVANEIKEYTFDITTENLYTFLMDFTKLLPLKGSNQLTEDSNELEYKIKADKGLLHFKVIEQEPYNKIVYYYDFSKSDIKEKGKLYLHFADLRPNNVKLKIRNEISESSGDLKYLNWIGTNLKSWIDQNIGKIVAKVVQTIISAKNLDDLTLGNFRILQEKIKHMGKKIDDLKEKFYEVKAPLTLTSFQCSECGATLNITSKEEKFILCEYCDTPFLMEWQKD